MRLTGRPAEADRRKNGVIKRVVCRNDRMSGLVTLALVASAPETGVHPGMVPLQPGPIKRVPSESSHHVLIQPAAIVHHTEHAAAVVAQAQQGIARLP